MLPLKTACPPSQGDYADCFASYFRMMNPLLSLHLTPLDRVLIRQSVQEARLYGVWEEWGYFVSFTKDGHLTVANTVGHTRIRQWHEVESIEKREPIIVRALTSEGFCNRLSSEQERNALPIEWHRATVIMAQANRHGHIDSFHISMDDGHVWTNADAGVIHADDFKMLMGIANRGVMPVSTSKRGGGADAKGQAGLDARRARRIIDAAWQRALAGATLATDHDLRVVR